MNQTALVDGQADLVPAEPPHSPIPVNDDRPRLAASLLAFQAAMYFVAAIEAGAMGAISGNAAGWGPVVLSLLLAIALLRSGHRVRHNRPWRRVRVLEFSLLGWAAIDLALAAFLSGTWLGLLATITRIAIPIVVITLLPRKQVR